MGLIQNTDPIGLSETHGDLVGEKVAILELKEPQPTNYVDGTQVLLMELVVMEVQTRSMSVVCVVFSMITLSQMLLPK
jgi:hypothetical protein